MPRISDDTIEEVRRASDIVDVVGDRVKLKKQGRRYVGLCPFHNEKTPSFSVDPAEGLYYCFGCRRGGDTFKFIQEMETVGFLDSVRLLADRAGIEIAEEGASPESDRKATLHAALRFAAKFYFEQLGQESGARALAYLKDRGFTPEAVRAFGMGAAPVGWDALARAAAAAGFDAATLEDVGLAKSRASGGGHYDVFRDRLMFPILSPVGKVLGFGGRILPGTPTASADYTPAKYINTPETEVYHKSRVLYGMKQAKREIRTSGEALVVEGYADVVSLWQAGVQNVVAASGTALTPQQMDALARLEVQRVVLLFDADDAGRSAARKGVEVALAAGLAPYAVSLPDGADPDSFVRQFGADAFRRVLEDDRMDFVDFFVAGAKASGETATPEGTLAATEEVLGLVRRIKNPVLADGYLQRIAVAFGTDVGAVRRLFEGGPARPQRQRPAPELPPLAPEAAAPVVVPVRPQEHELLRLMLRHGAPLVEHVLTKMSLDEFAAGPVRQTVAALLAQYHAGDVDPGPFVQGAHGLALQALVVEALAERHQRSDNWEKKMGTELPGKDAKPFVAADSAMRLLKLARVDEAIEAVNRRVLQAERDGADLTVLLQESAAYTALRRRIDGGDLGATA